MTVRLSLLALALLLSRTVAAEDSSIYESLRGVTIGRVFLTQEHRDSLDRRRLEVPRRRPGANASRTEEAPKRTAPAAGYIIGPDGRSKSWRDGSFVETRPDTTRRMSFPGDVAVERHAGPESEPDDGGGE